MAAAAREEGDESAALREKMSADFLLLLHLARLQGALPASFSSLLASLGEAGWALADERWTALALELGKTEAIMMERNQRGEIREVWL